MRHAAYWGGRPPLDGVKITFYQGTRADGAGAAGEQIDLAFQLSAQEAQVFKKNAKFMYYSQPTSAHRQLCMRTDQGVLKDARVRRAVALAINRPQQMQKILLGDGQVGNDNPFWKGFASTDPSIKQRTQNVQLAKALLAAAGAQNLKFNITTWNFARPSGPCGVDPGVRAGCWHRHRHRDDGRRQVLRLRARRGGLRDDDAVAEPDVHR